MASSRRNSQRAKNTKRTVDFFHFVPSTAAGKRFLFSVTLGQHETRGIYVASIDSGQPRHVLPTDVAAAFAPPNRLLVVHQGC